MVAQNILFLVLTSSVIDVGFVIDFQSSKVAAGLAIESLLNGVQQVCIRWRIFKFIENWEGLYSWASVEGEIERYKV